MRHIPLCRFFFIGVTPLHFCLELLLHFFRFGDIGDTHSIVENINDLRPFAVQLHRGGNDDLIDKFIDKFRRKFL